MMGETNLKACLLMSIFLLGMARTAASARTIYVDDDVPADFSHIQAAIDDSNDGDTIIVADGIYTGDGNRDIEFSHGLPEGQTRAITLRSANGPENCIIDCNGTESDRHRGFIFEMGEEDANSVISGFTITGGYARLEGILPPTGMNEYLGGAIYCVGYSSPTISNCIISGNTSRGHGGGIACYYHSNPTVSNCTFTGNLAGDYGGGLCGSGIVTNCVFWGNRDGGGMDESAQVHGSTAFVNYCCIQGWTGSLGGEGNIGDDPYFADPCNGDYHLKSKAGRWDPNLNDWVTDANTSPCIDAGNPMSSIGNEPFPNGGRINMGAYGGTAEASKSYFGEPVCETIVAGDINGDCKVNFKDFALMVLHWLEER